MPKMNFAIDIPQELLQKLEQFSGYLSNSVSNLVIEAIERYIDEIELDLMAKAMAI
jgi:predicted DNA-binding protein